MSTGEESLETFRGRLLGSAISTFVVCVLVVPLKLWCRISKRSRGGVTSLGFDDALCVAALVLATAFFFIGIFGLGPQLGKHLGLEVSTPQLLVFLEFLFPEQLLYCVCIATNKLAILAFYWRLFSIKARIPIIALTGIVSIWAIGLIIAVVLTCDPIESQWNPFIPGAKCSGLRELYLGGSVPNIFTDAALLLMPLPYIWRLNIRVAQRLMVVSIFLLGCFVNVVSIIRLVILMRVDLASADYTWKMKEVLLWSVVEVDVGLICACLPSMKPALRLLGLHRIFGSGNMSEDSAWPSRAQSPAFVNAMPRSRPKRFSSWAGMSKYEEKEDSLEMMNKAHNAHGTVETTIEPTSSVESVEHGWKQNPFCSVKRDWSVLSVSEPRGAHAR